MRKIKIVADSSANVQELQRVEFAVAPLKVITAEREFVDDCHLDVEEMVDYFDNYTGKSKTSCPGPGDWLEAFGDADDVFCVTITSGLSGSYNAACVAKEMYESEDSDKRVYVIDSLSAGPELELIVEKLEEFIESGCTYEDICEKIRKYTKKTGLFFALASLKNFAANGRVPKAVAKIAGVLGIRIIGKASDEGTLEPLDKCRGEAKSLAKLIEHLKTAGLNEGKVRIAHCRNELAATKLTELIKSAFPKVDVKVSKCLGLCSYYAELGGLLVGYEKA